MGAQASSPTKGAPLGNSEKYVGYLALDIANILDVATHSSWMLGGKVIRVNGYLSLKVNFHSLADLPMRFCSSFAQDTPLQLPRSVAAAQRSGGGATFSLDL